MWQPQHRRKKRQKNVMAPGRQSILPDSPRACPSSLVHVCFEFVVPLSSLPRCSRRRPGGGSRKPTGGPAKKQNWQAHGHMQATSLAPLKNQTAHNLKSLLPRSPWSEVASSLGKAWLCKLVSRSLTSDTGETVIACKTYQVSASNADLNCAPRIFFSRDACNLQALRAKSLSEWFT